MGWPHDAGGDGCRDGQAGSATTYLVLWKSEARLSPTEAAQKPPGAVGDFWSNEVS